jgi:hypothetical protein
LEGDVLGGDLQDIVGVLEDVLVADDGLLVLLKLLADLCDALVFVVDGLVLTLSVP